MWWLPSLRQLTRGASLGELHLFEYAAQVLETTPSSRPKAADRHAQLFGDLLVRQVVASHEQTQKTLASLRESFGRHSYRSRLLFTQERGVGGSTCSSASRFISSLAETMAVRVAILRLSRREVVASHPPIRSGCSIRSRFSTRRSQVVWHTSATSASRNLHRLAIAATIPPKRSTRVSQASPDPALASMTTRTRSSLS